MTFRDKAAQQPRIFSTDPATTIMAQPGDTGKLTVVVDNSYLSRTNLTPSLGAGMNTKLVSLAQERSGFRSTLVLAYEVSLDATPGTRDLTIRDNKVLLSRAGMLEVVK